MPARKVPSQRADQPGSPHQGEPVYLAVGLLRKSHGLRGDLLMEVYTDFPDRLRPGTSLFAGETHKPLKITRRRPHNDGLLLGFEGIHTPEEAARYAATVVYVPADGRPVLPEGEYYHHEIIGLTVIDDTGRTLGQIVEIIVTGANDVYVIKPAQGNDILIPALKDVILAVDLNAKTMRVHLLPGLLADENNDV